MSTPIFFRQIPKHVLYIQFVHSAITDDLLLQTHFSRRLLHKTINHYGLTHLSPSYITRIARVIVCLRDVLYACVCLANSSEKSLLTLIAAHEKLEPFNFAHAIRLVPTHRTFLITNNMLDWLTGLTKRAYRCVSEYIRVVNMYIHSNASHVLVGDAVFGNGTHRRVV